MIDEKKLIKELDAWWETLSPRTDARDSIICDVIESVIEKINNAERVGEWRRALRYPVIYREEMYDTGYGFYENGADVLLPEYSEVIAWQPLPEPYREENAE